MKPRKAVKRKGSTRKSLRRTPSLRRAGAQAQAGGAERLSPQVRPSHYQVALEVDPARSPTFHGEVAIQLVLERPTRTIVLHAADLKLSRTLIVGAGGPQVGRISYDKRRETAEIRFPRAIPAGPARLSVAFEGALRTDLRGLYAARSGDRHYAFTQLEAADARRFFPCFDEPAMKACLRLSVTTAESNAAISNAPIEKTEKLADGRKTVHFAQTPLLSTYLFALAVGELEASEPAYCGQTEIRILHVPGKGRLTGFALEVARETLARLEAYFDLPYPYAKLDLVAVPDFEAGAMENAGAVFFRETLLLVDPETVTLSERKRAAEVICHELAHMWYGDLVTMVWWNDLWLNESFATWMATIIVDQWKPEWKMWLDFEHHRSAALQLDALGSTHPIYVDVKTPADATQNFDLITYEKGAAVVRMIERYLGPAVFRDGVRAYIRRHREGNAAAADLWKALGEAAGFAVEPVARAWIEQPGFPVVSVALGEGDRTVELRQERFFARPRAARHGRDGAQRWPIPWVGRTGSERGAETQLARHVLKRAREKVVLGPHPSRFVYGNADGGGFFRALHDARTLLKLATELSSLAAVERMTLLGDQWAFVRAGKASIESFLKLAGAFTEETNPDVLQALRGPLSFVDEQLAPAAGSDTAARYRGWLVECFRGQLAALGWKPAPGEDDDTRMRRAALVGLLGDVAEWESVVNEAAARCGAYLRDRASLDANLADSVVALAARTGGVSRYESFLKAVGNAATPQERRRFLFALGEFRDPRLVDRTLGLTLSETVPTQDVVFVLIRLLSNRAARERTWAFVKRRWAALRKRMPPMLVTRLVDATPALQTTASKRDVASFFRAHPVATARRALQQALERFDLNAELRRREAPGLRRWFAS
ncbi:MAG TPA: M1 family aminopeptidase [Myxococcota bacterium]|nr:M1 family aminopeptidase [Myxococcota bacterium]